MKITKINYVSAVYFAAMALVLYLITGALQLVVERMNPGVFLSLGLQTPTALSSLVIAPLVGGLLGWVFVLFCILLYNLVAKKYPFSFKTGK